MTFGFRVDVSTMIQQRRRRLPMPHFRRTVQGCKSPEIPSVHIRPQRNQLDYLFHFIGLNGIHEWRRTLGRLDIDSCTQLNQALHDVHTFDRN